MISGRFNVACRLIEANSGAGVATIVLLDGETDIGNPFDVPIASLSEYRQLQFHDDVIAPQDGAGA